MDQSEATELFRQLRTDLLTAQKTVEAAARRVSALEKMLSGLLELFPGVHDAAVRPARTLEDDEPGEADDNNNGASYPRGQEAILQILMADEYRGRYWTPSEIVDELFRRGWPPRSRGGGILPLERAMDAVRTSLVRVTDANRERVKRVRGPGGGFVYYYEPPQPEASGATPTPDAYQPALHSLSREATG